MPTLSLDLPVRVDPIALAIAASPALTSDTLQVTLLAGRRIDGRGCKSAEADEHVVA